jgi:hypothetical protein
MEDRIEGVQKEIAAILPARDQYIVSISKFDMVMPCPQMIELSIQAKDNNSNKTNAA